MNCLFFQHRSRMVSAMFFVCLTVVCGCGGSRSKLTEAELAHKIDSVKTLEGLRQLKIQGIELNDGNPLQNFYDSLAIQPLPLVYEHGYIEMAPNYTVIPQELVRIMGLDEGADTRVIALPETIGTRLMLEMVSKEGEDDRTLWLYSLGVDYLPVDKIMLYSTDWELKLDKEEMEVSFSITSDYEIRTVKLTKKNKKVWENLYLVDEGRCFLKQQEDL